MRGAIPLDHLDDLLKWFDEGRAISIDEAYRRFNDVWMEHPTDLPGDPFSPMYAQRYFDIYKRVSGRGAYDPAVNERAEFDPATGAMRPFPFQGGSTKLAGEHFSYIARLLTMLDVPRGGKILEMGVGWGNTTLALAMLDYEITALDIEERYLEVIRLRSQMHNTPNISTVHSDFLWVERTADKFDAVIFFESFHHCREFERLLRGLHRVLKPGGKIYFAAEPINRNFKTPWCVRLDGQSLLVARQNGWMELGFHSDFFSELLRRTGWLGMEDAHPHFWTAQRSSESMMLLATDDRIHSQAGTKVDGQLHIKAPGGPEDPCYGLFGPGIALPPGRYHADITISAEGYEGTVFIDVCCQKGNTILSSRPCDRRELDDGSVGIDFTLSMRADDVEVRLLVSGGFVGAVRQLFIKAVD
jgi:ubiquinone/menaquinone biosynthesis C-methylase UbiE